MLIRTSRFGEIEVESDRILHFPRGIPGFEHVKRYLLIEYKNGKFNWLQAVDDPDLAFIVCDPSVFSVSYKIPASVLSFLDIVDKDDIAVLLIVRVERAKKEVIPHVQAPLVFNTRTRKGIQWVLDKEDLESSINIREQMQATA